MNFPIFKNRNFYIMLFGDVFLFILSLILSYLIRFDFKISNQNLSQITYLLYFVVPIKSICFFSFGLYRGMWRYSSISDMINLFKATLFSSFIIVAIILYLHHFRGYSRGVFAIDSLLTFLFTGGFRLSIRLLYSKGFIFRNKALNLLDRGKKKLIIIGAGDAGEMTLREIRNNPLSRYEVIGFVDDSAEKIGRKIHGIPILGSIDMLPDLVERLSPDELLIAIPSATGKQMRRIVSICEKCNIPYRTLPALSELIDGRISVKRIRDIGYDDLLRREPVRIEQDAIKRYLHGKRILITGAGGSIGSELCRQIVRFDPERMILLDASEQNLYEIQTELRYKFGYEKLETFLGNIQYRPTCEGIMEKFRPDIVVHAAAYKHVPLMELNPWEAVFNNICGSKNIMEAAVKYKVKEFIMVSTDKAVRPTNVMGATKRVCELIMHSLNGENGIKMMCVRFGNVIGSSGSVIPLFKKQIEYGGPVTVTHPEVTRYFMTIPEACQLILQAGAIGEGGEIFILDMGEPIKILDIAEDLIRLSGREPYTDIEIRFIGLRPGEKLYEELITKGEGIVRTEHEKIFVIKSEEVWKRFGDRKSFKEWLYKKIDELVFFAEKHDSEAIKKLLKEIVPEYVPYDTP